MKAIQNVYVDLKKSSATNDLILKSLFVIQGQSSQKRFKQQVNNGGISIADLSF